jgi:hypothetical protein
MTRLWLFLGAVLLVAPLCVTAGDETPLCTVAFIANPYITTLTPEALDERKGQRTWLPEHARNGLAASAAAAVRLQPDACVVFGSLSWSGSEADLIACRELLTAAGLRPFIVPGVQDVVADDNGAPISEGLARVRSVFAGYPMAAEGGIRVGGVLLHVTPAGMTESDAVARLAAGLAGAGSPRAVLLLGGPDIEHDRTGQPASRARYWELVRAHHVAAMLLPGRGHSAVLNGNTLPVYRMAASGWSPRRALLTVMRVYRERIELAMIPADGQPEQILTIPNPVAAPRLEPTAESPVPHYTADLARGPELTFVQLADSQLDDGTVARYAARHQFAEEVNILAVAEVNALKPALAFMTGDLVNKNTPAEWQTFARIYGELKAPLHVLPGNHELMLDPDVPEPADLKAPAQIAAAFAAKLAPQSPADLALYRHFTRQQPYYAFRKGSSLFICLDTSRQRVDAAQLQWVRSELEAHADAAHVFMLGHHPILDHFGKNVAAADGGAELLQLMKTFKVAAYLFGHRHRYSYRLHDGTAHILCDCLCWGEYRSFQIFHVFPDRIVSCWKPLFRELGNRPLYERVIFPEPRYVGPARR